MECGDSVFKPILIFCLVASIYDIRVNSNGTESKTTNQEQITGNLRTYEIFIPTIELRGTQNLATESSLHVAFNVFHEEFRLVLRVNKDLVATGFSSEVLDNGRLFKRTMKKDCYYFGESLSHEGSVAAISYCQGLRGMIKTTSEEYFIEPLLRSNSSHKHMVYRASDIRSGSLHAASCAAVKYSIPRRARVRYPSSILRNRRSVITDPAAQLLVVVDEDMVGFHGNDSIEEYVLTVMNMVSSMYRDPSLGTSIKIEVLKIIYLHATPEGLRITPNGRKTLRSFCDWQNSLQWMTGYSAKDHWDYDAAVLMTRKDICADQNEPCSTVGIGYMYGMCDPKRRCSVSEDSGLNVAFTIAHELAHNFGVFHDGDGNRCTDYSGYIPHLMSERWEPDNIHGSMKWSKCSIDSLQEFLRSKDSSCLYRHALEKPIALPTDLAGVTYSADDQCRLQYGNRAKHCDKYKDRMCQNLWCAIRGEPLCRTKRLPPARGTECGEGKWCMYGSCVNNTMIPVKLDGDWGEWSRWTDCSRTCGSGVTTMERKCDNPKPINGGHYCIGEKRRYRICNDKPCPEGSRDFREVQCGKFNNTKFKGKKYHWIPAISDGQPCALFCKPANQSWRFSAKLADAVVDGTPCAVGSRDICIGGKCQAVGCDHKLGSDAREDMCGVCKGNGTACYTVEGSFNQLAGKGYVEAALIPKGARNIRVREVKPCTSFLALRSNLGTYYINGNWKIQLPGDFDAEGTIFKYARRGTWERLAAKGPTTKPFHIMILYNGFNLGVKYKYTLPRPTKRSEKKAENEIPVVTKVAGPTYGWVHGGWGNCSVHCGGGIRKSLRMRCVGFYKGMIRFVGDVYCADATKPREEERVCNDHACPVWWFVSSWQPCSSKCGKGVQTRKVICKKQQRDGTATEVLGSQCTEDKPSSVRNCINKACHLKWYTGQWSKCFAMCGVGRRRRLVRCPRIGKCSQLTKPPSTQSCFKQPCDEWATGNWGECSAKCGSGYQRRLVKCRNALTRQLSDKCPQRTRPVDVRQCKTKECDKARFRRDRCLGDRYSKRRCASVLRFNLCYSKEWYGACCKTCENIAPPLTKS